MLVVVQKKGFEILSFFSAPVFYDNQRTWINKVLTHACVNALCKKKIVNLRLFLIYIKKKKHAPINHLMHSDYKKMCKLNKFTKGRVFFNKFIYAPIKFERKKKDILCTSFRILLLFFQLFLLFFF
jgi:hypothetical protein